jgi:hypothetical protein
MSQKKINPKHLEMKLQAYNKALMQVQNKKRSVTNSIVTVNSDPGVLNNPNSTDQEKAANNCVIIHWENLLKTMEESKVYTSEQIEFFKSNSQVQLLLQFILKKHDQANIELQKQLTSEIQKLQEQFKIAEIAKQNVAA